MQVVHGIVLVEVIDDRREPLVVKPPLPTLGLRPLTETHLNLLREGQVLLLLESSQEGPERWVGTSNQRLESIVPTFNKIVRTRKTSQNGVVLVPQILVEDWLYSVEGVPIQVLSK